MGTKSPCLGTSPSYAEHKRWGGVCQQRVSVESLLFQVMLDYRPENKSPKRCCAFLFGFLHNLGCTELGPGTWFTNKGLTVRSIWKLWFLKLSEIWQFHVMGIYMQIGTDKFFLPLTWVWKNPKTVSKTHKNHNVTWNSHIEQMHMLIKQKNTSHSTYAKGEWVLTNLSMNLLRLLTCRSHRNQVDFVVTHFP